MTMMHKQAQRINDPTIFNNEKDLMTMMHKQAQRINDPTIFNYTKTRSKLYPSWKKT
jgi:hypothetical protein